MQGLPFDDAEFPPPGAAVSSSWDQSPRVPIVPNPNQAAPVTDEELYRLVGAPPPSPPAATDDLIRYSQQMPLTTAQHLQSFPQHQQQQHSQQQQQQQQPHQRQHRQDIRYRPIPHSHLRHPSSAPRIPATATAHIPHVPVPVSRHHVPHASSTLHRPSISHQPQSIDTARDPSARQPAPHANMQMRGVRPDQSSTVVAPPHLSRQSVSPSVTVSPGAVSTFTQDSPKKPKRSAVEEARIRAQREAETFANSRRDPTKREVALHSPTLAPEIVPAGTSSEQGLPAKRMRVEAEPNSSNEYQSSKRKSGSGDEGRTKVEEESEAEKKERYKRRLDMNRESAAVSRVRRRAYVKELEERLAAVEAEKLQLEGKLEIMMSQNESLKKQLENLFLMVASGRRPTYPGPSSGQSGQAPLPPPAGGTGQ